MGCVNRPLSIYFPSQPFKQGAKTLQRLESEVTNNMLENSAAQAAAVGGNELSSFWQVLVQGFDLKCRPCICTHWCRSTHLVSSKHVFSNSISSEAIHWQNYNTSNNHGNGSRGRHTCMDINTKASDLSKEPLHCKQPAVSKILYYPSNFLLNKSDIHVN